jgi:hypothetical protein
MIYIPPSLRPLAILWATWHVLGILTLAYTRPQSHYRLSATAAILLLVASTQVSALTELTTSFDRALLTTVVWIQAAKLLSSLLINRVSFAHEVSSSWTTPLRHATASLLDYRGISTPVPARNIPPFAPMDPTYTPSRDRMIVSSIARNLTCAAFLFILEFCAPPPSLHLMTTQHERLFSRLQEVSVDELFVRVAEVGRFGARAVLFPQQMYSLACSYGMMHGGAAEPRNWPPLFGSLRHSYTVHGFWEYG